MIAASLRILAKGKFINVRHAYMPIRGIIVVNVGDGLPLTDNGGENDGIGTRPGSRWINLVVHPKQ